MKHRTFQISLFAIYIVAMTAVMIILGIGIAPDRYAFLLLIPTLAINRIRPFLLDWIPFLFWIISYDFLRSLAPAVNQRVHFLELIQADKVLFGFLPSVELQKAFFNPSHLSWYDYLATIFYFLHFALPLSFGYLLWLYNKDHFKEFTTSLLTLSYGAWITFILYPASPPWLAQQKGYLSGLTKIMDLTLQNFPERLKLPTIYHEFNANTVAAMPSVHAAYPFLIFLLCLRYFGKKGLWFLPYVLGVWVSIIYLGEHYFVDVLAGALYALAFYLLATKLLHNVKFHAWLKKTKDKLLG